MIHVPCPRPARSARRIGDLALLGLGLLLSACGGGGGGDAPAPAPVPAPTTAPAPSTALSQLEVGASFTQPYRDPLTLPSNLLEAALSQLPKANGRTYLKVWVVQPGTSEPSVLWLGAWTAATVLPTLQVSRAVTTILFEFYNEAGSVSGEWRLP